MYKTDISQNFNLTPDEFEKLSQQLRAGDETMLERIFLNHYDYCCNYLVIKLSASKDEAHEATMYALLKFRRAIINRELEYNMLRALFNQMAYYKVLRLRKMETTHQEQNMYFVNSKIELENASCSCEQRELLKNCIATLNNSERELLVEHYYENKKLTTIAELQKVSDGVIRKRKQRIIEKLKVLFEQKLNYKLDEIPRQ